MGDTIDKTFKEIVADDLFFNISSIIVAKCQKDGVFYANSKDLDAINALWGFTGDALKAAGHHTVEELQIVTEYKRG